MSYYIKAGYRERDAPSYFVDTPDDSAACQPDVYAEAAELARALGARTLVDLGCGIGDKLAALAREFDVVGVDRGVNLEVARTRHPNARWIDWDLEEPGLELPDAPAPLVLCIDLIEHLQRPERLLRLIRRLLNEGALALVLTTPDRDLVRGDGDLGPPENESHVREWNREELAAFLRQEGLDGHVGLTRSNTSVPWFFTTLVVVPSATADADAVARWWQARDRYREPIEDLQRRALAADALAAETATLRQQTAALRQEAAEAERLRERERLLTGELADVRTYVAELEAYVKELEAERNRLLARPEVPATVRGAARLLGGNALTSIRVRLAARRA